MMRDQEATTRHVQPTGNPIMIAENVGSTSAEVLRRLSATLTAFRRFKELEGVHLDPWEATSLTVAEQSLERAWLALSQLQADLQGPSRRA